MINVLIGTAVGDSLGMPFETMESNNPSLRIWDGKSYGASKHHGLTAGQFTDDTQMTVMVAESLIVNGFSPEDLSARYLEWIDTGAARGYGRTTLMAIANIRNGIHWSETGVPGSYGNGTAMRAAPFGVFFRNDLKALIENVKIDSAITHRSDEAEAGALAIALATYFIVNDDEDNLLIKINEHLPKSMVKEKLINLNKVFSNDYLLDAATPLEFLRLVGTRADVRQTVPAVLYCYLKFNNCQDAIETAIRAGGDTDTTAAIVGALFGAKLGLKGIPTHYLDSLEDKDKLIVLDSKLYTRDNLVYLQGSRSIQTRIMTTKPTKKIWSNYQKQIFFDVNKGKGHTIVLARAGSGKTTVLVESLKYVPKGKKILALAFNKIIQQELRKRSPLNVQVYTFHSLGFQAVKQRFGEVAIDNYKAQNIAKEVIGSDNYDLIENICQTVSLCKGCLSDSPSGIETIIFEFGIDLCEVDIKVFASYVIKVLAKCKAMTNVIDFDDMCWFPFVYNLNLGKYDYVFVDEFQDLNMSQIVMSERACNMAHDGRMMFFGDDLQDLYSWRGSDASLVKNLVVNGTAKVLSLPISYRCPIKIVKVAQGWAADIEEAPDAIEGEIKDIHFDHMYNSVKPGSFILSRTNAPLIKICLRLIRMKIKATIKGRDIGSNLIYTIKKSKKKTIPAFLNWLEKWEAEELEKLEAKKINPTNHLDKCECLRELCDEYSSLKEVSEAIKELFNDVDVNNKVILSSVHRAKGTETDTVFLLFWTFRDWFREGINSTHGPNEEMNIAYVAVTRAKKNLFLVKKS